METRQSQFLLDNARGAGAHVQQVPLHGHVIIHPTLSWPTFNWALTSDPAAVPVLAEALAAAGRKPAFAVPEPVVGSQPASDLAAAVETQGLRPGQALHHVYMGAAAELVQPLPPAAAGVTVVDAPDPEAWLTLLLDGFEVPATLREPFHAAYQHVFTGDSRAHLVEALVDGQRAGAACLWMEHEVGGLNVASVLPEFRSRGLHGALFGARVARALALGARHVALETAEEPVRRTAERFGLKPALAYRFWS
jgi:GNAT superfamily N-acetyltransferase